MSIKDTSEWQGGIQRSRTVLLNWLLLTVVGLGGIGIAVLIYRFLQEPGTMLDIWTVGAFFCGWLVMLVVLLWRRLNYNVRALSFLIVAYLINIALFAQNRRPDGVDAWMLLPLALAFVLLGPRLGLVFGGGISALLFIFFALTIGLKLITPSPADDPTVPATLLTQVIGYLFAAVILGLILWSSNRGWLEALRGTNAINQQLQSRTQELETVNVQLSQQASQLQATAEIAHAGSSTLDPDTLSREAVNRIQEGFSSLGVYYVGLFVLDEAQEHAVLKAATGDAGKLLLELDHKLEVDETTMLGWCIVHQEARFALDLEEGSVQLDILPMPHTRSEIALPLRSRGRVLGALSVQSTHETAFAEAEVAVLQMVADQVAVALDNARLFSQTQAALQEVQVAHRRYLAQAWREFLASRPTSRVDYAQPGTETGDGDLLRQTQRAAVTYQRTVAAASPPADEATTPQAALVVPLKLRGQVIGTMALHETRRQRLWTAEEVALAETIAEQVTLTVENLRLMDEAQRRVVRERAIREISDRMQRAADMETLMRITTEELNQALSGDHTYVRLSVEAPPGPSLADERASEGEEQSAR